MAVGLQSLLRITSSHSGTWQVAIACACGVLCGLLPKSCLLFYLIAVACFFIPMHLPLGCLVAGFVSLLTPTLEPALRLLGSWSLSLPWGAAAWGTLEEYPLLPWLNLQHSLIHGSLLLGLLLFAPISLMTRAWLRRCLPSEAHLLRKQKIGDGDFAQELKPEIGYSHDSISAAKPVLEMLNVIEGPAAASAKSIPGDPVSISVAPVSISCERALIHGETVEQLEQLLATCRGEEAAELSSGAIAERAAQMADYVDRLLASCDSLDTQSASGEATHEQSPHLLAPTPTDSSSNNHFRIESTEPPQAENEVLRRLDGISLNLSSSVQSSYSLHIPTQPSFKANQAGLGLDSSVGESAQPPADSSWQWSKNPLDRTSLDPEVRQEEVLRYLLHHLRAVKDKVNHG